MRNFAHAFEKCEKIKIVISKKCGKYNKIRLFRFLALKIMRAAAEDVSAAALF